MKVEKSFHIEGITLNAPSHGRENLAHVRLDAEHRRLLATDGRVAAIVPCEVEEGDTAGYVTAAALRAARKVGGKQEPAMRLLANGSISIPGAGISFERPSEDQLGPFPDIDRVTPATKAGDERPITIGLDAELLVSVARAIGCHGDTNGGIRLVVSAEDRLGPMVVLPSNDRGGTVMGLIMPQRL